MIWIVINILQQARAYITRIAYTAAAVCTHYGNHYIRVRVIFLRAALLKATFVFESYLVYLQRLSFIFPRS